MNRLTSLCLAVLCAACGAPLEPSDVGGVLLRTDAETYTLERTDDGLRADIPFTFTNATGETVFVVNCNGIAPPALEKWTGEAWVQAYSPVVPACLSPPVRIAADARYTGTLHVRAGLPDDDRFPKFDVAEPAGRYRLVWHSAVHEYDQDARGFGRALPREHRTSNPFTLAFE